MWKAVFTITYWLKLSRLSVEIDGKHVAITAVGDAGSMSVEFSRLVGGGVAWLRGTLFCNWMCERQRFTFESSGELNEFASRIKNIAELTEVMKVHTDVIDRKSAVAAHAQRDIDLHSELFEEARKRKTLHIACLGNFRR